MSGAAPIAKLHEDETRPTRPERTLSCSRAWRAPSEAVELKLKLLAIATPIDRYRQANSRAELHCASEDASVRSSLPCQGGREVERGNMIHASRNVEREGCKLCLQPKLQPPRTHAAGETTVTTDPPLTANLLHPSPRLTSISPPLTPLLHPITHLHVAALFHHKSGYLTVTLLPSIPHPVRPSKEPRSSFLIPFELFSNGSKGIRERATRLRQTGF